MQPLNNFHLVMTYTSFYIFVFANIFFKDFVSCLGGILFYFFLSLLLCMDESPKTPLGFFSFSIPLHWSVMGPLCSARQEWESKLPTGSLLMGMGSGPEFSVYLLCLAGACFA